MQTPQFQAQTQISAANQTLVQPQVHSQVISPVANSAQIPAQQVFQVDQSAMISMLQQMMEEMRSWRNNPPMPTIQPMLRPQIYSQGSQAPQIA